MEKKAGRDPFDEEEGRERSASISEAKPSLRREASKRHSSILNDEYEARSRQPSISDAKVSNDEDAEEMKSYAPSVRSLQSITGGGYNQTYLIMKPRGDESLREVFFRCGNWCYKGDIEFFNLGITVAELPSLIPTLQRSRSNSLTHGSH